MYKKYFITFNSAQNIVFCEVTKFISCDYCVFKCVYRDTYLCNKLKKLLSTKY